MKINKKIIQALIDNDFKTLNKTGFIYVNPEGKTEKQYIQECKTEALNQLFNGENIFNKNKILHKSSFEIDSMLNLNTNVMRDIDSIKRKNILTHDDKTKETLVISNNGNVILKDDNNEIVIPFDFSKKSVLSDYCDKVVNYSFYHCDYEDLSILDCLGHLRYMELDEKTDPLEYINNKIVIHDLIYEIENGSSQELAYNIDILDQDEEASFLTIKTCKFFEVFMFEQEGKVTIINFRNNSLTEYYEDDDFEVEGETFTAGAGVLETVEMQFTGLYKMDAFHREIDIEDDEPEIKIKNKYKP